MRKFLLLFILSLCYGASSFAQWTSDPEVNTRVTEVGRNDYGREMITTEDGISYIVSITPEGRDDNGNFVMSYRLQIIDKDGYQTFPEEGLILCTERNMTYTVTNQHLLIDKDGNAIVIAHDCRNSAMGSYYLSYTVYKVTPDGTILWSTDLADGEAMSFSAAMKATQTTDGGYVFTYSVETGNGSYQSVRVEKLTADGKVAWDEPVILTSSSRDYSYPYVVDAGFNQTMLIYCENSNNLYARMLDFDGSSVWKSDVPVQNCGGLTGSVPVWTFLKVKPAPDGGAFVLWRDGRNSSYTYANYVSYIKNDGSYGFPGSSTGLKISYADDYSRLSPNSYYSEEEQCLYLIYRQYNQSLQSYAGIFMQKISIEGELLWGEEGKAIIDIQDDFNVDYSSVQGAGGTDVVAFYQVSYGTGEVYSYAIKLDKDGNELWDKHLNFTTCVSEKSNLESSPLIDGTYWIANWYDYRDYSSLAMSVHYAQRINIDGTLGDETTGIKGVASSADYAGTYIYNASGQIVKKLTNGNVGVESVGLNPGLYIVKDMATGSAEKIIIK